MLFCLMLALTARADAVPNTALLSNLKVLFQRIVQTPLDDPSVIDCSWQKILKVSYDNQGLEGNHIFYTFIDCLDEHQKLKSRRTFFSYIENQLGTELPEGCPPPIVPSVEEPDKCGEGKLQGKRLVRIVARLTVSLMIRNVNDNPLQQSDALRNYLAAQLSGLSNFSAEQNAAVTALVDAALTEAEKKLKCLIYIFVSAENPNVEGICAKTEAEKNLQEAVTKEVLEQTQCGSVGCAKETENESQLLPPQIIIEPPVDDIVNGFLMPQDGSSYLIGSTSNGYVWENAFKEQGDNAIYYQPCTGEDKQRWTFKAKGDNIWEIKSVDTDRYIMYNPNLPLPGNCMLYGESYSYLSRTFNWSSHSVVGHMFTTVEDSTHILGPITYPKSTKSALQVTSMQPNSLNSLILAKDCDGIAQMQIYPLN